MSLINLAPPPTVVSGEKINVSGSASNDVSRIVFTTDGSAPTIARHIAYDTLTPANPFISVVQDGRGNCLFDGGFPKWYNTRVDESWATFNDLTNTFKYFYNALSFICNNKENKNVLFIGDKPASANGTYPSYHVKDRAGSSGFGKSIDVISRIAGITYDIIASEDFQNNIVDLDYVDINEYDGFVIFGTDSSSTVKRLSDKTINNLILARESGRGILIVTDHGNNEGTVGFFYSVNFLAKELGALFVGDYNRTPVSVGYLIDNYGDHVLWSNMSREESIYAGGSESKVIINERESFEAPPSFEIAQDGWTTVRYLIEKKDGTLHLENYTYGLNVQEFVSIEPQAPTLKKESTVKFSIDYPDSAEGDIRGVVRVGGAVVCEFIRTKAETKETWFTKEKGIAEAQEGDRIEVAIQHPFSYFHSVLSGRRQPDASGMTHGRVYAPLNMLELKGEQKDFLNKASDLIDKKLIATGKQIKALRNYIES